MPERDGKPVVLVVDDTPDNLTLIAGMLREFYKVKVAASGDRALAVCAAGLPDLILLDILMPGLDGFEVCRRLKADPVTGQVPVVFLSGSGSANDRTRGTAMGASGFLTKPVEAKVLLETVARVLGPAGSDG